jgi:tyrosyl-tRNA synthetase
MSNVVDILRERGLLEAVTSPALEERLARPVTVYAGFDPTSDSLQAGNYVAIMALCHFQRCGHRVVAVVGGGTGLIGDPAGKAQERALLGAEDVRRNAEGVRENLSRFLDFNHPTVPARLVNNLDWLGQLGLLGFLRDVGKHFRLGAMLDRESVRARLESEAGLSFTEFSYQLLQAYDFLHLYDTAGCELQIGGSDQWGNITAGIDLIRRLRGAEAYGLTIPLVCDATGQKFGKSQGNALYLDERKTSCYRFYQFFVRTLDSDVVRYLRAFTFLPAEEIAALAAAHAAAPEKREAHRRLAEEVTRAVHGEEGLRRAQRASSALFGESMAGLRAEELLEVFADVAAVELPRERVLNASVVELAAGAGLCRSKGEARRLVESGGLYLNNARVAGPAATVGEGDLVDGRLLVLRSGKKTYHLVRAV